ncbi:aldo/keto reductase [Hoeflea poritis]|uniref:Aldo/keto reductase n=1 Tax=Hoeflea poritis TaxID=2993659 RepID=A0ABT4VJV8_9HYPH|nr:aldo/keto reductase [Hoeflea poritis]MDA4844993.1 aldo/keto reductase [Hoeflea poritis]
MTAYFQRTHQRSFGTYPLQGEELKQALAHAIEAGYRSIDTAQMYENEADVGEALQEIGTPRSELFITTKVHPDNFTEERFIPSVRESLDKLKTDYVDVLLLHWPPIGGDIAPSLRLLEEAHKQGLARHIGVSNYTAQMMREARDIIDAPLVTNQVEFHPLLNQDILHAASVETGIPLSSYCSVARGEVFKYPLFEELAEAYGKTPGQIVLRWILQKGVSINTMSTKPHNIHSNFDVMDFSLSSVDMARIDALTQTGMRIVDESLVPWAPKWD